jgi:hypothetical protein
MRLRIELVIETGDPEVVESRETDVYTAAELAGDARDETGAVPLGFQAGGAA